MPAAQDPGQDSVSRVNGDHRTASQQACPPSAGLFSESPVFVLSASRSGSTLLRFILDSHPVLACPPETGVGSACTNLVQTLHILESAASGASVLQDTVSLSGDIVVAVRRTIDDAYGRYLRQRGKNRWCDKSLDSFLSARLFARLYPQAKFICLYRHCMDVIASGVEACPWGVSRFGFDAHVAQNPGNSVAAIGSYWLDCNRSILEFQKMHPERCHQVRYEDLVATPEKTAGEMFSFLGVESVPDIADQCFRTPHDAGGPGDEKIWFTSGVTTSSVGRGIKVPVRALSVPLRAAINELLEELDYRKVQDDWNKYAGPLDPRARCERSAREPTGSASDEVSDVMRLLRRRAESRAPGELHDLVAQWPALAGQTLVVVVADDGHREELRWTFEGQPDELPVDPDQAAAILLASPAAWRSVIDGKANLITEIIAGNLQCVNNRDGYRLRSNEVHAIAAVLGLAPIPLARIPDGVLAAPA